MKTIARRGFVQALYYTALADGSVEAEELDYLSFYAKSLLANDEAVAYAFEECGQKLAPAQDAEERKALLFGGMDRALSASAGMATGLNPRLLIWNMIVLGYADGSFDGIESDLVRHVAAEVGDTESAVAELIAYARAIYALCLEIEAFENDTSDESTMRVDEAKARMETIKRAATNFVADADFEYDIPPEEKGLVDGAADAIRDAGAAAQKALGKAANLGGSAAVVAGAAVSDLGGEIVSGAGKLLGSAASFLRGRRK